MIGKKLRRLTGLLAALVLFACAIIPTTAFGATTATSATAMGDSYYKNTLGIKDAPSLTLKKYQGVDGSNYEAEKAIKNVKFKYVKVGGLYQVELDDGSNVLAYGITSDFAKAVGLDETADYSCNVDTATYYFFKDGTKIQDATRAKKASDLTTFLSSSGAKETTTVEGGLASCALEGSNPWGLYLVVETDVTGATDASGNALSITKVQTPFLIALPTMVDNKWDATIEAQIKNATDEATVEKKIITDDDGTSKTLNNLDNLDDTDTTSIGDTVWYRLESSVPAVPTGGQTIKKYVLSDVISKGLSVNSDSFQVVMWDGNNETPLNGDPNDGTPDDYTLNLEASVTDTENAFKDGSSFTITFTEDGRTKLDGLAQSKTATVREVYVRYSATVNDQAVIGPQASGATPNSGNPNEVKLTYQVDGSAVMNTAYDRVTHFTFGIDVAKELHGLSSGSDDFENAIKGVKFKVYTKDADAAKTYYTFAGSDGAYNTPATAANKESATTLKLDGKGKIKIDGLELGTYYLEEIETAAGYRLLNAPVEFVLKSSNDDDNRFVGNTNQYLGTLDLDEGNNTTGRLSATVVNTKGFSLPSTGESGTLVFVLLGAAVFIAAGLFLARTSKANKK